MLHDKEISQWVLENISNEYEFIGPIAKFISNICEFGLLWLLIMIALMVYYYLKNKKINFYFLIVLVPIFLTWCICEFYLKNVNIRIRPFEAIEEFKQYMDAINYAYPKGYSFPSGHCVVAFGSAYTLAKFNKKYAPYAFVLAILVAFSRLVIGAHYLSDIIAGIGFGLAAGAIGCAIADYLNPKIMSRIYNKETKTKNEVR